MTKQNNKKFKKKWFIIPIAIFAVVAVACALTPNLTKTKNIGFPVSVGTAEQIDLKETVSIRGTVQGSEKAEMQSTQIAEVKAIKVEEGDNVKKGQLLAVLDSGDLNEQYAKTKLALSESKRKYENSKVLYEQGALAQNEYLDAKAAYESDLLNLDSYDFDKVNIKSPIDGTITRVNVTVGSNANDTIDNKPMFVIEDLKNLLLKIKVSEYDINRIKEGQKVIITSEMLGDDTVSGTVSKIAPSGENKDGSSEMVIPVEIKVDNEEGKLIAGVSAKAEILINQKEKALAVPVDSILEDVEKNESYVFVVKDNKAKKIKVKTGIEGDFNIEVITSELKPEDKVILAPTFDITDGMDVSISEAEQM